MHELTYFSRDRASPTPKTATPLSWCLVIAVAALGSGCFHSVPIERGSIAALMHDRPRHFEYDGQEIVIDDSMNPQLQLERNDCSFWELGLSSRCIVNEPLADLRLEGQNVVITTDEDSTRTLPIYHIAHAHLRLSHWIPPDFEQHLTFGISVLGAAGLVAVTAGVMPWPQLVLEAGGFGAPDGLGTYFFGVRIRPVRLGIVWPFIGAMFNFVGLYSTFDATIPSKLQHGAGGRIGLDIELGARRFLLTLEFDLVRRLDDSEAHYFGYTDDWLPMGGAALSYAVL